MTNEEARDELVQLANHFNIYGVVREALDIAIEALKETDMGLNNGDHLHPFGEPFGWTEEEIQKHGLRELIKEVGNENDELSCSEKPNESDTIYRQDAINKFEPWLKVEGYSEGEMNMLKAILYELTVMPSAQTEIIRCKDCKWYGRADKRRFYRGMDCLQKRIDTIIPDKDFCSRAERRTDG